jgi:hypothetical protein
LVRGQELASRSSVLERQPFLEQYAAAAGTARKELPVFARVSGPGWV